jgi:hypothetical protein
MGGPSADDWGGDVDEDGKARYGVPGPGSYTRVGAFGETVVYETGAAYSFGTKPQTERQQVTKTLCRIPARHKLTPAGTGFRELVVADPGYMLSQRRCHTTSCVEDPAAVCSQGQLSLCAPPKLGRPMHPCTPDMCVPVYRSTGDTGNSWLFAARRLPVQSRACRLSGAT